MAPQDLTDRGDDPKSNPRWVDRAPRHDLHLPIRYRLEGQVAWHPGETINISKSGMLFCSNEMLELHARLEVVFHNTGIALPHSSRHLALVVRRVLSNWPETRLVFGVRFSS